MLMLMLVAAVTLWLCPLVTAQPLCRARRVRTGKVFNVMQDVQGDRLSFSSTTPRLITHPCKKNIALYLGKQVFFTTDNFETSLLPFAIPTSMQVGVPEVTSAHFAGSLLLLVVAQKVYIYDYENNSWNVTFGIKHPVTHVSGDNCCYTETLFCMVKLWLLCFLCFPLLLLAGLLCPHQDSTVRSGERLNAVFSPQGMFKYSDHPLNRSLGLSFDYNGTLDIVIVPGQRGILLLWFEHSLLFSHNAGQLVDTVRVKKGDQTLFSSMFEANVTIHNIAVNENELAVITREDNLYYGNLGVVPSSVIKVGKKELGLWAEGGGSCLGRLRWVDHLRSGIEFLTGEFIHRMYSIDMNSQLQLTASLIPQPGASLIPLVSTSGCFCCLGFSATLETGFHHSGKDIYLKQQQHWGRTDPNFTSSVFLYGVHCIWVSLTDLNLHLCLSPLQSTLISVGCDLDKKIIIQNKISACSKGILDALTLQDNYSFIIEKWLWPGSSWIAPRSPRSSALCVCPRWRKDTFQEIVEAEYVLLEVNGQFSYRYSLNAKSALCTSQPQNWTTMIKEFGVPFVWNRE
uniref:Cation channel sperm-associated auxiliary subunit delta n=1 Tax=Aotus nancymaae TaxID=37293 RepID=A0A2K5EB21_AOTNA